MTSLRRWLKRLIREAVRDELVRAGQTSFEEAEVTIGDLKDYYPVMKGTRAGGVSKSTHGPSRW